MTTMPTSGRIEHAVTVLNYLRGKAQLLGLDHAAGWGGFFFCLGRIDYSIPNQYA